MNRKLFQKLKEHLPKKEFTIITGARQTGKSTLLKQLEKECLSSRIPYISINLENKEFLMELDQYPLSLLKYLPETDKKVVVFLDEVQYLKDPSNFLKLLYDEHVNKIKIVATGSTAFYIVQKFTDSLSGRKRLFQLYTCSFDENLVLSGHQGLLDEYHRLSNTKGAKSSLLSYIKAEWDKYMIYGGYPAVITETNPEDKILRLQEIRDSFIKRDITESGVRNETAFYQLMRLLAAQTGGLVNTNKISIALRITQETIQHYIYTLQKCFHISLVKPFYRNLKKELIKMPKVYFNDIGLKNSLLNNFQTPLIRSDRGELWENIYFRYLLDHHSLDDIHYWRTADDNEVDFVLPTLHPPVAIETKYDIVNAMPSKYNKFKDTYPEIGLEYSWIEPWDERFCGRVRFDNT
ncbi:MAG: ATP-binding protein [Saprospiraceae bacterium]